MYQGRDEALQGAHARGYNHSSISVCIIGNFDKKKPSKKQMEALCSFLVEKARQYKISPENIKGHGELLGVIKSCPGKNVDMDEIRAMVAVSLSQGCNE